MNYSIKLNKNIMKKIMYLLFSLLLLSLVLSFPLLKKQISKLFSCKVIEGNVSGSTKEYEEYDQTAEMKRVKNIELLKEVKKLYDSYNKTNSSLNIASQVSVLTKEEEKEKVHINMNDKLLGANLTSNTPEENDDIIKKHNLTE